MNDNKDLNSEELLFFEFSKGSILESAGRDDLAIQCYYNCKTICEKLVYNHPDRALPYMGIGSVFFYSNEFGLALRAFIKVLII